MFQSHLKISTSLYIFQTCVGVFSSLIGMVQMVRRIWFWLFPFAFRYKPSRTDHLIEKRSRGLLTDSARTAIFSLFHSPRLSFNLSQRGPSEDFAAVSAAYKWNPTMTSSCLAFYAKFSYLAACDCQISQIARRNAMVFGKGIAFGEW